MSSAPRSAEHAAERPELIELARRLRPGLSRVMQKYRIPPADVEDLLQDLLVALWVYADHIRAPKAWLFAALRYRCRSYLRQARPVTESLEALPAGELPAVEPAQPARLERHDLAAAIASLPWRDRRLLHLRDVAGLSRGEVCREMGVAEASYQKIRSRALARLRRSLTGTASG